MRYGLIIVSVIMTISLSGCGDGGTDLYAYFLNEKAAWEKAGIDHYRFTARAGGPPISPPITVTVIPGKEPEVWYNKERYSRDEVDYERPFDRLGGKTISELYESIDFFMKLGIESLEEYDDTFESNNKYHYPERYRSVLKPPPGQQLNGSSLLFVITAFEDLRE
jgi:hypothetical protein